MKGARATIATEKLATATTSGAVIVVLMLHTYISH